MPNARMASGPPLPNLQSSREQSIMMVSSSSFLVALLLAPLSALTAILSSQCAWHVAQILIHVAVAAHHWKKHCIKSSLHKDIRNHSCILLALVAMESLLNSFRNIQYRVLMCPLRHPQPCRQRLSHHPFQNQKFLQIQCLLQRNLDLRSDMARAMPQLCQMMKV